MSIGRGYYVYGLISLKDGKFYFGFTRNIIRRIRQHNIGENISTKSRIPFKLVFYEFHLSKKDALRRERYFKTKSGKRTIKMMLRESLKNFDWGLQ